MTPGCARKRPSGRHRRWVTRCSWAALLRDFGQRSRSWRWGSPDPNLDQRSTTVRVLERVLVAAGGQRSVWRWELGLAAALGVALALPLIASLHAMVWAGSSLGGALTTYPAACAAYGFVRARSSGINPLPPALAHFLGPTLAATLGLVAVVLVWRVAAR